MIEIIPSEQELRIRRTISGELPVAGLLSAAQGLVETGEVHDALRVFLPLTQRLSDYYQAVLELGHDPNNAITLGFVSDEMRRFGNYEIRDAEFKKAVWAINSDSDELYDRFAYAIAKHWLVMLVQDVGLDIEVNKAVTFAREHPVPPAVPNERQSPRRSTKFSSGSSIDPLQR